MSDYFVVSHAFSAVNTAEKVVNAVDFDRYVHMYSSSNNAVFFGFTATAIGFVVTSAYPAEIGIPLEFLLPANEELWAVQSGSGNSLTVLVTGVR